MRKYLVVFIIISTSYLACSQAIEQKGFLGISFGAAIPVATFASSTVEEDGAGYAQTGYTGFISSNIFIRESFGFAGLLGFGKNPYNATAFTENYRNEYPEIEYEFTSDPYEMLNILGGAFIQIPQGIMDINLKGYIGVSIASSPANRSEYFSGEPGDPHLVFETGSGRASALTYGGGINLVFYTSGKLAFVLDAHYLQAKPEFNAVEIAVYEDGKLLGYTAIDLEQKFQVVILSGGVALAF